MKWAFDQHDKFASPERTAAIMHAVLDSVIDAIITIDSKGRILQVNQAVEKLFGYTQEELIGQNVSLLMPSPYREEHDGYMAAYLRSGQPKIIGKGREIIARKKDGSIFPIDLAVTEVLFDDSLLFTAVIRDMWERQATEEALKHERAFSSSLIETANAIILLLDNQGNVQRINTFMEQLSGYSKDEACGRNWFEAFIPPEHREEMRDMIAGVLEGEAVRGRLIPLMTRSGDSRQIAWSVRRIMEADQQISGVIAIGNDVTELREAQEKLVQSARLAAIGEMMTGLAHESRNALQRTRACLEMLALDAEDHSPARDLINRAQNALSELQRLYEEVRGYAAPLKLEWRSCAIDHLCRQTWEHLNSIHSSKKVSFRIASDDDMPVCRCDRARIQQVIRNILENALDAAPPESCVTVTIKRLSIAGNDYLNIAFRDEGPGIDEEQAARIFEPFFTTKTKGTGLGLAIAKRIVEAHGGRIVAESPSSGGANIQIRLPVEGC